jgi:hypothetical protein
MRERFWTLDMSEIIPIPSRYTIPGAPMPHAQSHAATRDPVIHKLHRNNIIIGRP